MITEDTVLKIAQRASRNQAEIGSILFVLAAPDVLSETTLIRVQCNAAHGLVFLHTVAETCVTGSEDSAQHAVAGVLSRAAGLHAQTSADCTGCRSQRQSVGSTPLHR